MPSGGNHPPANPAAVSGPGALSRRTDQAQPMQKLDNPKYGEQGDFQSIQRGAPMQAPPNPVADAASQGVPSPVGFGEPSQNPGQPVTFGADAGAGAGSEALNLPKGDTRDSLRQTYGPILPALIAESQSRFATQAFKDAVQALIAIM